MCTHNVSNKVESVDSHLCQVLRWGCTQVQPHPGAQPSSVCLLPLFPPSVPHWLLCWQPRPNSSSKYSRMSPGLSPKSLQRPPHCSP